MKKKIGKIIKDTNILDIFKKNNLKSSINTNPSYMKRKKNDNQYKILDIKKSNDNTLPKTDRENLNLNTNDYNNYSIDFENTNEEDEFNSDEYISSTMLEVETNTYIDDVDNKSNKSSLDLIDNKINKITKKSSSKLNNKAKNYAASISANN